MTVETIQPWLLLYESAFLHSLCLTLPAEAKAINIGAGSGASACAMLRAGVYVASVDIDPAMHECEKKMVESQMLDARKLFQIKGKSSDVAKNFVDEQADLVFVDGLHNFDGVTNDLNLYAPKVTKGGLLVCHDYTDPRQKEVTRAIKAWRKANPEWLEIGQVLYMIAFCKPGGNESWRNGRV